MVMLTTWSLIRRKKLVLSITALLVLLIAPIANCNPANKTDENGIQHKKPEENSGIRSIEYYEDDSNYAPDDIPIFDSEGNKVYLEQFEGNLVLIAFWATWCSYCANEMVDLDILQKDFRKLPFKVIPISEDYNGLSVVKDFYQKNELRHLPMFHDNNGVLFKSFGLSGLPTMFLVNEEGVIVAKFSGLVRWHDEEIRAMLLSYIPGNHPMPRNTYKESSVKFMNENKNNKADSEESEEVEDGSVLGESDNNPQTNTNKDDDNKDNKKDDKIKKDHITNKKQQKSDSGSNNEHNR